VAAIGALVVAIVSARLLGPGGRGEVVLVLTVCILCMKLVDLGVNTSGRIKILRGDGTRVEDFLGLSLVLTVVQAVVVGAVLLLPRVTGGGLSPGTIAVGTFLGTTMFLTHMLVDACFAVRRTLQAAIRDVVTGVVPLILLLVVVLVTDLSVRSVLGMLALGHVAGAVHLWMVVRRYARRPRFEVSTWVPMLRSGLPVLGGSFSEAVAYRSDRLVVGVVATATALGVYSVAATTVEMTRLLLVPATQILANRIASGQVPLPAIRGLVVRLLLLYWGLVAVVGLAGGSVVLPLIGSEFGGIHTPLAILAVGEALFGLYLIGIAVLTGLGRFRRVVLPASLGSVLIVFGGPIVVPEWGIVGASWLRVAGFGAMGVLAAGTAVRSFRHPAR